MRDQAILREIGALLWGIFPPEAARLVFEGQYLTSGHQAGPVWYDAENVRMGPKAYTQALLSLCKEVSALVLELRGVPPFDNDPFTHLRYHIDSDGKMDVTFAQIPDWDSWPGLFMRGISDLEEADLARVFVPHKDWKAACARRRAEPY